MRSIYITLLFMLGACAFKPDPELPEPIVLSDFVEEVVTAPAPTSTPTRDYIVEGVVAASEIGPDYQRLVLREGSRLVTEGRDLTIEVDEIVAEGGVIESFPEKREAGYGQAGRSSGSIRIRARKAQGHLTIISRGEIGGPGLLGTIGATGAMGSEGSPAKFWEDPNNFLCQVPAGNGGQGGVGARGTTGGTGYAGGNAASVQVQIAEESDFVVSAEFIPGIGGRGGWGGPGGLGGPGGPAGKFAPQQQKYYHADLAAHFIKLCRANAGAQGAVGPQGDQGVAGPNGSRGHLCGYIGSSVLGVGCAD